VKYRQAVRAELEATLAELSPGSEPGLFGPNVKRPPLAERIQLWGLADRLARNLAALDLDPGPPADAPAPRPARAAPRRARAGRIAGL
jgi:hypothetical protein